MQTGLSLRLRQAAWVAAVLALLWSMPAAAFDLFARYQVTVPFATPDGKPMADADVRVFAPGQPDRPALTGHTDSGGKFEFSADKAGLSETVLFIMFTIVPFQVSLVNRPCPISHYRIGKGFMD